MASYTLGRSAKAYYSATLFTSTDDTEAEYTTWLGTATVVDNIMDLTLNVESETVDATTRSEAARGFRSNIAVIRNGSVTFDMRWDPVDTLCDKIATSAANGTEIAMAFLNKAYATASTTITGICANFTASYSLTQNLGDIQRASVTLTISSYPFDYEKVNA